MQGVVAQWLWPVSLDWEGLSTLVSAAVVWPSLSLGKTLHLHVPSLSPGVNGYLAGQWLLVCLNSFSAMMAAGLSALHAGSWVDTEMNSSYNQGNNGVRRPRQIHGPKIRANVPPKGPCWRHRVCHLGAIVIAWAARWRLGVGRV